MLLYLASYQLYQFLMCHIIISYIILFYKYTVNKFILYRYGRLVGRSVAELVGGWVGGSVGSLVGLSAHQRVYW